MVFSIERVAAGGAVLSVESVVVTETAGTDVELEPGTKAVVLANVVARVCCVPLVRSADATVFGWMCAFWAVTTAALIPKTRRSRIGSPMIKNFFHVNLLSPPLNASTWPEFWLPTCPSSRSNLRRL